MAGGEASAPAGGGAAKSRTGRKLTASKRLPSVRAAADEQASNAEAPDVGDRGEPGPTAGAGGRVAGGATQGGGSDSSTAGGGRGGSRGAAGGGAESSARGGPWTTPSGSRGRAAAQGPRPRQLLQDCGDGSSIRASPLRWEPSA